MRLVLVDAACDGPRSTAAWRALVETFFAELDEKFSSYEDIGAELDGLPGRYSRESLGAMFVAYLSDADAAPAASDAPAGALCAAIELAPEREADARESVRRLREHLAPVAPWGLPVGCIALKKLSRMAAPGTCEMKRMYVRPEARAFGVGRRLAEALMRRGAELGYETMVLESLLRNVVAHQMYSRLGFVERAPYYSNPLHKCIYMERPLADLAPPSAAAPSVAPAAPDAGAPAVNDVSPRA